jgi:hypothetical protein
MGGADFQAKVCIVLAKFHAESVHRVEFRGGLGGREGFFA